MKAIGWRLSFFRLIVLIGFATAITIASASEFDISNFILIRREPGVALLYLDLSSVKRNGPNIEYRTVLNFENSPLPAQSAVYNFESNCNEKIIRTIVSRTYSAKFGRGQLIAAFIPSEIPGGIDAFRPWSEVPNPDEAIAACRLVKQ